MLHGRRYKPKSKDVELLEYYILKSKELTVRFNRPTKAEAEGRVKLKRRR